MDTTVASAPTNWKQIYSLMALNAAIVISWIAYHNYQPKVLEIFHFQKLSLFLVIAQALILVFIPPVAGAIADRVLKSGGNRFVVFTVGISVTAMVFMCVAFTIGVSNTIDLTAALPFMIVVWLISMNIFHSPANSMLELFAPAKALPSAMAMMVLTTDLLYAIEPVIVNFVDAIGPVTTFAFGGVLLIVTGYFFRTNTRDLSFVRDTEESKVSKSDFVNVLITGLVLGVVAALLKNYVPQKINDLLASGNSISGSATVSIALAIAALTAWPLSKVVDKMGTQKSLRWGLVGSFVLLFPVMFATNAYAVVAFALLSAPFFSLASVAAFPFALGKLAVKDVTLGAGIFFGSAEVADGILNYFQTM